MSFIVWLPQLLEVAFAALLLVVAMLALRRFWIRWVLMWMPYYMVGYMVYGMLETGGNWNYTYPPQFSIEDIMNDSLLWEHSFPTFLAIPFLLILHILLSWREVQRNTRVV
jgi:hypothetical protein